MCLYVESKKDQRAAQRLRTYFAELTGITSPEQFVLYSGIGLLLVLFLRAQGVKNCVIGRNEYLADLFLTQFNTTESEIESMVETVLKQRPHAVMLSLVSFDGSVRPVARIFKEIRKRYGRNCPLLIADCAHAGAIGFPSLGELGADIICLDTGKWVMEENVWASAPVLLWFSDHLYQTARQTFSPFALAVSDSDTVIRKEALIDVRALHRIVAVLPRQQVLRKRLRNNLAMAKDVARELQLPTPKSSLLTVTGRRMHHTIVSKLDQQGLVWRTAGSARIKCRSDVYVC